MMPSTWVLFLPAHAIRLFQEFGIAVDQYLLLNDQNMYTPPPPLPAANAATAYTSQCLCMNALRVRYLCAYEVSEASQGCTRAQPVLWLNHNAYMVAIPPSPDNAVTTEILSGAMPSCLDGDLRTMRQCNTMVHTRM